MSLLLSVLGVVATVGGVLLMVKKTRESRRIYHFHQELDAE